MGQERREWGEMWRQREVRERERRKMVLEVGSEHKVATDRGWRKEKEDLQAILTPFNCLFASVNLEIAFCKEANLEP